MCLERAHEGEMAGNRLGAGHTALAGTQVSFRMCQEALDQFRGVESSVIWLIALKSPVGMETKRAEGSWGSQETS